MEDLFKRVQIFDNSGPVRFVSFIFVPTALPATVAYGMYILIYQYLARSVYNTRISNVHCHIIMHTRSELFCSNESYTPTNYIRSCMQVALVRNVELSIRLINSSDHP